MNPTAEPLAIELRDVTRRMGRDLVLRGVNLEVAAGRLVVLRGANGTGKTTLIRLLATRLRPSSGKAFVFGHELPARSHLARGRIGLLSVVGGSYPMLDARENLGLTLGLAGRGTEATASAVGAALESVGLAHAGGKLVRTFSSGMKKRLALARLLLLKPDWALLDEPASALDVTAEAALFGLLREELPQTSFVVVAHREPRGLGAVRTIDLDTGPTAPIFQSTDPLPV